MVDLSIAFCKHLPGRVTPTFPHVLLGEFPPKLPQDGGPPIECSLVYKPHRTIDTLDISPINIYKPYLLEL